MKKRGTREEAGDIIGMVFVSGIIVTLCVWWVISAVGAK